MGEHEQDQRVISTLLTIATRTWTAPTGQHRAGVLARLREIAGDRTDLLAQAAGIMLGLRPADEADPNYTRYDGGAELLLEVADVDRDDKRVQEWVPVGVERRNRWRRPEAPRGW
ncbi:hypothetical protein [Actinoallomurus sp. CA-142502]|uniref:hypothetical protein n=1 Tax=Actinoallomurus sp. CA-142502 TaxID=3239885 RepID=UPI003D8B8145